MLNTWLNRWKFPSILLFGIGLSNIGAWIYFIALNLIVLNLTASPLALSFLYIIRPIAGVFANMFAGSIVDRVNKKRLMIIIDLFRGIVLLGLILYPNLVLIYVITFIVQMASHIFGNASFAYITKLIPEAQRPRFNSLNSLMSSGAFIIGPAIAGLLFIISSPELSIVINSIILIISGFVTILLPNVDKQLETTTQIQSFSKVMKEDFIQTIGYYRLHHYIMYLCICFGGLTVVMATAVDSLEASFATLVLHLTEGEYGFLVSIAGIGMGIGAIVNVSVVNKIKASMLLRIGVIGNAVGYCIYAFSTSFLIASVGFFVLAFFLSFANSAFMTIYQNHIKVEIIGRVGAFNGFIESVCIIVITLMFGIIADLHDIRPLVIIGSFIMLLLSLLILMLELNKTKIRKI